MKYVNYHHNQVITNLGLTPSYPVHNGIDQGETITPLLWRIYYDPLISYIHAQVPGYTLQSSWTTNLKLQTFNSLQKQCSVLAYMDDILWVASSQTELFNILSKGCGDLVKWSGCQPSKW